ncbi:hypothetical protein QQX98_010888 [Neonectria punicea]|uniref:DUF4267 domain-containing protein n=1 Tax=Neonectria punicea TaxID=979145 RepID=A0ABR1GNM1_9HYPO
MPRRNILDLATAAIGTLLAGSGLYGIFAPANMARTYGIVNVNRDMAIFFTGIGGRNLGAGLAVLALTAARQRKALGMFLSCWVVAGIVDTYLLLTHDDVVDQIGVHVFNTCVLALVGPSLLLGY